jgi:hypothetical protein
MRFADAALKDPIGDTRYDYVDLGVARPAQPYQHVAAV